MLSEARQLSAAGAAAAAAAAAALDSARAEAADCGY